MRVGYQDAITLKQFAVESPNFLTFPNLSQKIKFPSQLYECLKTSGTS